MEIFLAKLLGLYFVIVGLIVLIRRRSLMPTISDMVGNKPLLFAMAVCEIVAGLALVLAYPVPAWSLAGILSVIGYMMVVESLIYMAAPARFVRRFVGFFNRDWFYVLGGLVSVIVGAYLAGVGFGYF